MIRVLKGKLKKQYLEIGSLCLLILVSDFFIFFEYASRKYVYSFRGWGYDTYHQFIPELELIYQIIEDRRFGLMCFQDGLGIDIMSIQRWVTDPFTLLILIFALIIGNKDIISELIVMLPVMVSLFGGVFCYLYLKRYIKNARALILAAYMYGLSGYLFSTGTHYWFASFLVYFPLLLIAVDKVAYENKYAMFISMVFVVAIHGAYGAFPMFISAGVYLLLKVWALNNRARDMVRVLMRTVVTGIIGMTMSAFLFIPNLYEMIDVSGRIENTSLLDKVISSFKIINFNHFATALSRLFSNNLAGGVDDWHAVQAWFCAYPYFFSILFIFLAVQYIRFMFTGSADRKQRQLRIVGTVIILFTVFTNFVPELFNLFNYNQWRMIFVLLPFWAFISAKALENMICDHAFSHSINVGCGVGSLLMLYVIYRLNFLEKGKIYTQCIFFICSFTVLLALFNSRRIIRKRRLYNLFYIVIFLTVAVNLIMDHRYSIVEGASPVAFEEGKEYYSDAFISESVKCINEIEGDSFVRLDRTYLGTSSDTCWSYVIPCRSVTMYNSILNSYTKDYVTQMVNLGNLKQTDFKIIYAIYDYGSYFDAARAAMLGLKYVITDQERNLDDWDLLYENNGKYLYRNSTFETGGLLYDICLSESLYEELGAIEKACIEGQAVVLNEDVEYDYNCLGDLLWTKETDLEKSVCQQNEVDGKQKIYIPIERMLFSGSRERNFIRFNLTCSESANVNIGMMIGNTGYIEGKKNYNLAAGDAREIIILLPDDCTAIEISSDMPTELGLEKIQLFTTPITYSGEVNLLNEKMGNVVHGRIQVSKPQILYCSIPYLKGWKAYIDGEEVKILKANYGFMAVEVPQGEHEINFIYRNPVILWSVIISCIGVIGLVIYIIQDYKTVGSSDEGKIG